MARTSTEVIPHTGLRVLLYWLPIALCVTVLSGLIYVVVQQSYRQTADDPQIQMAEDIAVLLDEGARPQDVVGEGKVNMITSLAPFIIVYDTSEHVVASSAQLNGSTPDIPHGVFDSVRFEDEDRLTWQPQEGVRVAAVVRQFSGNPSGFVLVGRSLREVEKREDWLTFVIGIGWIVAMVGSLCTWMVALGVSDRITGRRTT